MTTAPTAVLRARRHSRRTRIRLSHGEERTLGALLVVHAIAHSVVGLWASVQFSPWAIIPLWESATLGFLVAGVGAMGVVHFHTIWREASLFAAFTSTMLLFAAPAAIFAVGFALNLGIAVLVANSHSVGSNPDQLDERSRLRFAAFILTVCLVAYTGSVIALRPWTTRWGTTSSDLSAVLPGDKPTDLPQYSIDHAISIAAPPSRVWPWLVQIGQGRAGFYSYTSLENAVGARIANANRIVPAWQTIREGDFIRAVPPDWMGGRFGKRIGWRVSSVIPERALLLEGWGAFVLTPVNGGTRMMIRTRGPLRLRLSDVALSPISVFVFEPAHFIMQRRMLIGIKERAELPHGVREVGAPTGGAR